MNRWTTLLAAAATCLAVACCKQWPPALTAITMVAVNEQGTFDLRYVARTALGPPLPVIVVRPGPRPERPGLPFNEPKSGRISVTLARGTQSFSLYTTEWKAAPGYVIGLFFDHHERPAFAVRAFGGQWEWSTQAVGLDGSTLVPADNAPYSAGGFRVTLDDIRFPIREPALDLAGPWRLRPDQLADLVGTFRLTVTPASAETGSAAER